MGPESLAYRLILKADEDGFRAIAPAFPSIFTCGDSVEDALDMARDAIELEVGYALDEAQELPDSDGTQEVRVAAVRISVPAA